MKDATSCTSSEKSDPGFMSEKKADNNASLGGEHKGGKSEAGGEK